MVKYTSNDIIKRAEQLADLQNSDFITDYEKLALLNESFQMLYQKVINANDKTWIKTIEAYNGMELPQDFYQLSALYVRHTKEQIVKMNPAQLYGYEIKNNVLYFSPNYNNVEIVMEYWPIPPSFFLKKKTVDAPYNQEVIAADKNIFAYKNENNELVIADTDSDYAYNLGNITFSDIAIFQNAVLLESNGSQLVFRFDNETLATVTSLIPAVYEDNLYFYNAQTQQIIDLNYNIYIPSFAHTIDASCYIIYFDNSRVFQLCPDYYYCNSTKIDMSERKLKCVQEYYLFAVSSLGQVFKADSEGIAVIQTSYPAVCLTSNNYVLTKRNFGNKQFLEGLTPDSVLAYPNNLFFTMLAYMLAMQFKIKQSADVSGLSALYESASTQFFDSLNRDANASYQIKNAYQNRNALYVY